MAGFKIISGSKKWLSRQEAVEEGYFSSIKQAADLASRKEGPTFYRPNNGRVLYKREDLEEWVESGRVITKPRRRR